MTTKDRIENAIRHIQTAVDVDPWAVEIAVEAMQEKISREQSEDVMCSEIPNDSDCISRQEAIDILEQRANELKGVYGDIGGACKGAVGLMRLLPSAQPERKTVNLRVEKISKHQSDFSDLDAEPERKTGRWMRYGEDGGHNDHDTVYWQCDQCLNTEKGRREKPMRFCPSCGARMQP